jgi:hypothetical protein
MEDLRGHGLKDPATRADAAWRTTHSTNGSRRSAPVVCHDLTGVYRPVNDSIADTQNPDIPTIGLFSRWPPIDPSKGASP